jgi:retinol dehydrogenase 12
VYIAARNQKKAEEAIDDLKETTGKEALFLPLDLADLKSVKTAAEDFSK